MAHLPYADPSAAELQPLVQRIVAERGSLLHLYQMLLHSPPLAEGWLTFMTRVRQQLELPGDLRELVIMRIAHINRAPYEAAQHAPIALKEGLRPEQLDALPDWAAHEARFTPLQAEVLRLCDEMSTTVQVGASRIAALRTAIGARQTVELVATIASYHMVSRFLEALHVHEGDARDAAVDRA
jgi:AhpD family alkylhydroperoxidase